MELEYEVPALEPLAENIRNLYKPKEGGGGFVLDVKGGMTSKSKVDEFRNKNIELVEEMKKFKDVDPEKYAHLVKQQKDLEEGELLKKGDVEGLIAKRVQGVVAEKDKAIKDRDDELGLTKRQLEVLTIDNAVKSSAVTLGVLPTAIDDVVLRAKTTFVIEKGKTVAKDGEGNPLFAADGTTPLSVADWTKKLKTTAPHLFQGVQGSGGGGGNNRGADDPNKMTTIQKISHGLSQKAAA